MYPIYFFILAILGSIVQFTFSHVKPLETILLWLLISNVGLQGLFAFIGHFFMADKVAKGIGWPINNPFQTEIAFTNLAFGILGILCIWLTGNFWAAVIIGRSIFLFGAAYTHIRELRINNNRNSYNIGPVLWLSGIIIPILLLGLLILTI